MNTDKIRAALEAANEALMNSKEDDLEICVLMVVREALAELDANRQAAASCKEKLYRWVKCSERMPPLPEGDEYATALFAPPFAPPDGHAEENYFDNNGVFYFDDNAGIEEKYYLDESTYDEWQWLEELPPQLEPSEEAVKRVAKKITTINFLREMDMSELDEGCRAEYMQVARDAIAAMQGRTGEEA